MHAHEPSQEIHIPPTVPTVTPYMFSIDTHLGPWTPRTFEQIRALLGEEVTLQGTILYAVPRAEHNIEEIIAGLRRILGQRFLGAVSLGNLQELQHQRTSMASPKEKKR
jgi:hypothetical protein